MTLLFSKYQQNVKFIVVNKVLISINLKLTDNFYKLMICFIYEKVDLLNFKIKKSFFIYYLLLINSFI